MGRRIPIIACGATLVFVILMYYFHEDVCGLSYPPPNFSSSSPPPAILLTGASRGIGRDMAVHLATIGYKVFAGVRKETDGASLIQYFDESIKGKENYLELSDNLLPVKLDVTNEMQRQNVYRKIVELDSSGEILFHGLVHNAAVIPVGPMESLKAAEIEQTVEVNFLSPILLTHTFLPLLRMRMGRVVFISSLGEAGSHGFHGPYEGTKRGLSAFSDSLRRELIPFKVYVGAVLPGLVKTDMFDSVANERGVRKTLSEDQAAIYGGFFSDELIELREKYLYSVTHSPELCSLAVEHAMGSSVPHTHYMLGPHSGALRIMRLLPDWYLDRQFVFLMWPGPIPWESLQTESLLVFIFATIVLIAFVLSFFYGFASLFFR